MKKETLLSKTAVCWPMFHSLLLQVSQAVLLDNFVQATARIEGAERGEARQRQRLERRLENPLDPLLERLVRDHVDDCDLSARIHAVFRVCVNKDNEEGEGGNKEASRPSLFVRCVL
jgi:hypothetical protein